MRLAKDEKGGDIMMDMTPMIDCVFQLIIFFRSACSCCFWASLLGFMTSFFFGGVAMFDRTFLGG